MEILPIEQMSKPNTPFERLFNMTVFGFISLFKIHRKWIHRSRSYCEISEQLYIVCNDSIDSYTSNNNAQY